LYEKPPFPPGSSCMRQDSSHGEVPLSCYTQGASEQMERKIFWITFTILGLAADFVLPIWWALVAAIPIGLVSWWVAYRSDWF
jgi:hypothetical protein